MPATEPDYDSIDFFTDPSLVADPFPYFDHLRSQCPVRRTPHHGVVAVTGHEEAAEVYKDHDTYSSCVAVGGPFPPLPFVPRGTDISAQIDAHRDQLPMSEHMVTMDPPEHSRARSLLRRLLTPRRLAENERYMWRLADRQLDEFIADGRCEFLSAYAKPFSLLVIADVLGVPEEDRAEFRAKLGAPRPGANIGSLQGESLARNPLEWLEHTFADYLHDRRGNPRDDVLTGLATARYPEGDIPEIADVVKSATLLFAAGQETTTKLLSAAVRLLAERPDLAHRLRGDRSRIPNFVEEMLRTESPVKSAFRLARKDTTLGAVDIPAGTVVMVNPGAINRDPRRFDDPHSFDLDRHNVREHLAFGRGAHSCPGGPLTRIEGKVSVERILDRMTDIRLSEAHHGPPGARRFTYEPTFILHGLTEVHLEFTVGSGGD